MKTNNFKYIVSIEGSNFKFSYNTYEDATEVLKLCMPCKATIEAIDEGE